MEMMRFQSSYFELKNGTAVFWKSFSFSRKFATKLKHWQSFKVSTDLHKIMTMSQTEGYFENP